MGDSNGWTFMATRLNGDGTESVLDPECPLRDVSFTEYRNAPTAIAANIEPETLDLVDSAGLPVLRKWSTMIYAEKEGDIHAGGILVDDALDGAQQSLDFMGMAGYPNGQPYTESNTWPDNPPVVEFDEGLEDVFETRQVAKSVPYTKTVKRKNGTTVSQSGWKQVKEPQEVQIQWARDPQAIQQAETGYPRDGMEPMYGIREIWRHLQAQPGGNLGMMIDPMVTGKKIGRLVAVAEFTTPSGVLDLEYEPFLLRWFETHDLGDVINELCENLPLEFREEHTWNEARDGVEHFLRFGHPGLGQRRTDIKLIVGENVDPVGIDPPADEYASHVIGLGAGEGRTMVRGDAIRSNEDRIRRAVVFENKDASTLAAIAMAARAELLARIGVDEVTQVKAMVGKSDELRSLMPGDQVYLGGDQAFRDVDMWVRIESKTTYCSDDSLEFGVQRVDRLA
jgi:hypothetical protein